jgi:hypothetical protein
MASHGVQKEACKDLQGSRTASTDGSLILSILNGTPIQLPMAVATTTRAFKGEMLPQMNMCQEIRSKLGFGHSIVEASPGATNGRLTAKETVDFYIAEPIMHKGGWSTAVILPRTVADVCEYSYLYYMVVHLPSRRLMSLPPPHHVGFISRS